MGRSGQVHPSRKNRKVASEVHRSIDPGPPLIAERMTVLTEYPWSSWRANRGAESTPPWLNTSVVGPDCGGRSRAQQGAALRAYTEAPALERRLESPWPRLHKWVDDRTKLPWKNQAMALAVPSPGNPDMVWLSQRTSVAEESTRFASQLKGDSMNTVDQPAACS